MVLARNYHSEHIAVTRPQCMLRVVSGSIILAQYHGAELSIPINLDLLTVKIPLLVTSTRNKPPRRQKAEEVSEVYEAHRGKRRTKELLEPRAPRRASVSEKLRMILAGHCLDVPFPPITVLV